MGKQTIAGISISDNLAHLTVFEIKSDEERLIHLEELQKNNTNELWFLESLTDPKNKILKNVSKVSVALDLNSSIIHLFPMDTTLNPTEQDEHVHWEFSNIVPDYVAKDYVHDIHTLNVNAQEQVAEVLVVAVKKIFLSQIQEALGKKGLELHVADTTFFGAEQTFIYNYPESRIKPFAILYSSERRVDIGIEAGGKLIRYGYILSNFPDDVIQLLGRLSVGINLGKILCCGPLVLPHFNHLIKDGTGIPVEMFNPFRLHVKTSTFNDFKNFNNTIQRYAASTGVALWK